MRLKTGWAETLRAGSGGGGCGEGRVLWAGWGLVLLLAWNPVPVRCGAMPSALRSGFWGDLGVLGVPAWVMMVFFRLATQAPDSFWKLPISCPCRAEMWAGYSRPPLPHLFLQSPLASSFLPSVPFRGKGHCDLGFSPIQGLPSHLRLESIAGSEASREKHSAQQGHHQYSLMFRRSMGAGGAWKSAGYLGISWERLFNLLDGLLQLGSAPGRLMALGAECVSVLG